MTILELKKEFNKSKLPINFDVINVDQIVVPDKFRHNDDGFIGYKEEEIVETLCIILPQMTGYIKYYENGGKNMSFVIKDDDVLGKRNEIWDKITETLSIKFHSMPDYDEKYIKAKVREFNGVVKTNFLGDKIPNEKAKMIKFIESELELESEPESELESDNEFEFKPEL